MTEPVHRVRFEPAGIVVEVTEGTTLWEAAHRARLPVGTACKAEGICGRCGLRVLEGAGLTEETEGERRVKEANRVRAELRLSCQAGVTGDLVVTADYW